jgi:hypothetical protein
MPIIHGAKLRFGIGKFDWHGIIGIPRRHDMMVHVDAPVSSSVAAHRLMVHSVGPTLFEKLL